MWAYAHKLPILLCLLGFGLMDEQGAESIHTAFNQLNQIYANIHNGIERLYRITTEKSQKQMNEGAQHNINAPTHTRARVSHFAFILTQCS